MIFIIGSSIAFFLEFILIAKKHKSLADKILTCWMFVIGTHLLLQYFEYEGLDQSYQFLVGVMTPFPLIQGPLLFLYVQALTTGQRRLKWYDYLHILPFLLVTVWMIPFFLLPGSEKLAFVDQMDEERFGFKRLVLFAIMISGATYVVMSLAMLRRFRRRLRSNYSYTDKINLDWLRNLILGMVGVWSIVVVGHGLDSVLKIDIASETDYLIYLGLSVFVLVIGYFGIQQTQIFTGKGMSEEGQGQPEKLDPVRYQKSGLKPAQAEELMARLQRCMKDDKPYLDHRLTMNTLASKLDIHPNYLSQVINEQLEVNFYDFINKARLEEFLQLAQKPKSKNLTILALALDSGFSSKSSFNKFFKRTTGKTPSQYLKSISF